MPKSAITLSPEALSALMSTGNNRQGKVPQLPKDSPVWAELRAAGLIGEGDGLTRAGSIERQRRSDALIADLLG